MLVGSAFLNTDFSLLKNFPIHESMKLRFRAEFFNAFNRPQLGTPDGTMTSFDPNQLGTIGTNSNTIADNRDFSCQYFVALRRLEGDANPPAGHS
jgi:hypothetical protein